VYPSNFIYYNRYIKFALEHKPFARSHGLDLTTAEGQENLWLLSWAEHDKRLYHDRSEAGKWERLVYVNKRADDYLIARGFTSERVHQLPITGYARKNLKSCSRQVRY